MAGSELDSPADFTAGPKANSSVAFTHAGVDGRVPIDTVRSLRPGD